ncbi:hypothetical protein EDB81DRAFT_826995 [Dactylonectria macrodidyma]|uniref:Uncharacterized protein n=1 Tax=Dactylonectria macrodidyma TaxID=307937 RepID=A0A9P9D4P2_9HYPO|nr:hypothetical protein EDB81DRAFT_826995 [Dactylonectria macrodidyma]
MAFDLQTFRRPCDIGFRVEVHDADHPRRNCTFDPGGNMRARDPSHTGDAQACLDHLRWRRSGGPFISFFTNWNAALRRQRWMIEQEQGATEVLIVAVWLKGLPGVWSCALLITY